MLGHSVLAVRQTPQSTCFRVVAGTADGVTEKLRDYFQLNVSD